MNGSVKNIDTLTSHIGALVSTIIWSLGIPDKPSISVFVCSGVVMFHLRAEQA